MQTILVYVVRHGTTELNESNVYRGGSNPDLNRKGYKEANQLAFFFEPLEVYEHIFTSDKRRASNTAKAIAQRKDGVDVQCNEGLRPWHIGDFGGLEKNAENRAKLEHFIQNPDEAPSNGESLNAARGRVIPLVQDGISIADQTGLPVVLVVHSSVIHMIGEEFGSHHECGHVKPGGVAGVYYDGQSIGVAPMFKEDTRARTQNVLGTKAKGGFTS